MYILFESVVIACLHPVSSSLVVRITFKSIPISAPDIILLRGNLPSQIYFRISLSLFTCFLFYIQNGSMSRSRKYDPNWAITFVLGLRGKLGSR